MFKFMIIFNKPANVSTFEGIYNDLLALIERMPDIQRRQVVNIVGSPTGSTRLYRILEVYYDDQQQMETSLNSPAGQEAGGELQRFPAGSFDLIFAEVYEEEGGRTRTEDEQ
ncbi:MAG: EthD family reductase [Anaerolineae bacterium]|nr:EthD family reductase [Anaerolineae bacterium]